MARVGVGAGSGISVLASEVCDVGMRRDREGW